MAFASEINYDLIREILLMFEREQMLGKLTIEGYSEEDVYLHAEELARIGYIEPVPVRYFPVTATPKRITPSGYRYLSFIHNENSWARIRERIGTQPEYLELPAMERMAVEMVEWDIARRSRQESSGAVETFSSQSSEGFENYESDVPPAEAETFDGGSDEQAPDAAPSDDKSSAAPDFDFSGFNSEQGAGASSGSSFRDIFETLFNPNAKPEESESEEPVPDDAPEDERNALTHSVTDLAAKDDFLGFEPYVAAVAKFLIDEKTKGPLTVSIEGEWGSGKSSFMLQLEERLNPTAAPKNIWQRLGEHFLTPPGARDDSV